MTLLVVILLLILLFGGLGLGVHALFWLFWIAIGLLVVELIVGVRYRRGRHPADPL